ncbi:MAG: hypothetical protein K8W52_28405 [Deltaproteobacteria bacterium]|nr:hypothetical protein [Deltaproteobacteria bacterium]
MASRTYDGDRRLAVIIGVSIAVHAGIAVYALAGDPPEEHALLAAKPDRIFMPDVEAEIILDANMFPDLPTPSTTPSITPPLAPPITPAATPTPAPAAIPQPTPARPAPTPGTAPRHVPSQLPESATAAVDSLFGEGQGNAPGSMGRRSPGSELERQLREAQAHGGTAELGNGGVLLRGDGQARPGTSSGAPTTGEPGEVVAIHHNPERVPPPVVTTVGETRDYDPETLSPDEVLRIITTKYMAGLIRCQHDLLLRDSTASGKVSLVITIDASGAVASPSAKGFDAGLDACVEKRAAAWSFPVPRDRASGEATSARYRLSLALQAE